MLMNIYGDRDCPVILLLPPMMVTGEELYRAMLPHFKGEYCFIAPDHGSHGKAGKYISADQEYRDLKSCLLNNGFSRIRLLYGASLGATMAYRLFCDPDIRPEHVWLDGLLLKKSAPLVEKTMKDTFLKLAKDPSVMKGQVPKNLADLVGQDFAKLLLHNFKSLSRADIQNICHGYCRMDPAMVPAGRQKRIHLEYGEDDFALKPSEPGIRRYLPLVKPVVRKGYKHCEYMAVHMGAYVKEMEKIMELS